MKYDPTIHRRRSIRLPNFDYSQAGAYFVTICLQNKDCLFGDIINGMVKLSPIGEMLKRCWKEIPDHFPIVGLDDYVIMPNHIHGIIFIDSYPKGVVSSPLRQNIPLGKILAYYKYLSTKMITELYKTPGKRVWQRNFYEHIIRDGNDLNRIREYIIQNPLKWDLEKENPGREWNLISK